jgi:hypothetical protein
MSRPRLRLAERVYGLLVGLYPKSFQQKFGWSMTQTFRDLLDDPDIPRSRIWRSVVRDLGSSLLHEHLATLTGGRFMARFALSVGALRVAMLVVLIGATPLATGAVGYYLGRSQVQPVAESESAFRFPYNYQTFYSVDGTKWKTPLLCPVAISPGVTALIYVLVEVTGGNPPRCPTAVPSLINERTLFHNPGADVVGIREAIRWR